MSLFAIQSQKNTNIRKISETDSADIGYFFGILIGYPMCWGLLGGIFSWFDYLTDFGEGFYFGVITGSTVALITLGIFTTFYFRDKNISFFQIGNIVYIYNAIISFLISIIMMIKTADPILALESVMFFAALCFGMIELGAFLVHEADKTGDKIIMIGAIGLLSIGLIVSIVGNIVAVWIVGIIFALLCLLFSILRWRKII